MSNEYRFLTYDLTSTSGNKLSKALGARDIRPEGSRYVYVPGDIIINWGLYGSRGMPIHVNPHAGVEICTSKTKSYRAFNKHHVKTVVWTADKAVAKVWQDCDWPVYARHSDSGCQGAGIEVCLGNKPLPSAYFYTRGFPVAREFRIYTWRNKVLSVFEKKQPHGVALDLNVRASDDWLYCRDRLDSYPADLLLQAIGATKAVGLDFSGVDIALDSEDNVCVFECNSAPWLSGKVAEQIATEIKKAYPL